MSLLARVSRLFRSEKVAAPDAAPGTGVLRRGPGTQSVNGTRDALQLSAAFSSARVLANTVSCLPIHVYRSVDKTVDTAHWLNSIFRYRAGGDITSLIFRMYMTLCVVLHGNAFAKILRNARTGVPFALVPLHPDRVKVKLNARGSVYYEFTSAQGAIVPLESREVFHLRGFGDALIGYSVIEYAARTLSLATAQDKAGVKFYTNSGVPEGVLTAEKPFAKGAREDFVKRLNAERNTEGFWILEGGMKFEPIAVTPKDAQLIESRRMSAEDIFQFFGVPPDLHKATEDVMTSFATFTIAPLCVMWDEAIRTQLMSRDEADTYYTEHNLGGLYRANATGRAALYNSGLVNGWMVPNEARRFENLPAKEGGDQLRAPLNTAPIAGWWLTINEVRASKGLPAIPGGDALASNLKLDMNQQATSQAVT
jgi:HK97 family phage portal protein